MRYTAHVDAHDIRAGTTRAVAVAYTHAHLRLEPVLSLRSRLNSPPSSSDTYYKADTTNDT